MVTLLLPSHRLLFKKSLHLLTTLTRIKQVCTNTSNRQMDAHTDRWAHTNEFKTHDIVSISQRFYLMCLRGERMHLTVIFSAYRLFRVYTWLYTWNRCPSIAHKHTHTYTYTYSGTHACTHRHSPVYALQVCRCKILISYVPSVVTASSPISALTCSSPSVTHTHTLPALSAAAAAVAMGTPSTGWPMFPKDWENPCIRPCRCICVCVCVLLYHHMSRSLNAQNNHVAHLFWYYDWLMRL